MFVLFNFVVVSHLAACHFLNGHVKFGNGSNLRGTYGLNICVLYGCKGCMRCLDLE